MRFNPLVIDEGLYSSSLITTKWGGDVDFSYEHDKYWPELLSLCEKRRTAEQAQWQELGGTVGTSEWDIKSTLRTISQDTPPAEVEIDATAA